LEQDSNCPVLRAALSFLPFVATSMARLTIESVRMKSQLWLILNPVGLYNNFFKIIMAWNYLNFKKNMIMMESTKIVPSMTGFFKVFIIYKFSRLYIHDPLDMFFYDEKT
jgi:hypothetical protein